MSLDKSIDQKYLQLPLDIISFQGEMNKLVMKILSLRVDVRNHYNIEPTLGYILDLDPDHFSKMQGVGKSYVKYLYKFKENIHLMLPEIKNAYAYLHNSDTSAPSPLGRFLHQGDFPYDLSCFFLNRGKISPPQEKLVGKLERTYKSLDIKTLLSIDIDELNKSPGWGKVNIHNLSDLNKTVIDDLNRIADNSLNIQDFDDGLLVYSKYFEVSFSLVDKILIDDIENYLFSLDDISQDTSLSRWGFHHDNQTLEEIGCRHGVTRERIRQLEARSNINLPSHIRIHPKVLSQNIRENISSNLVNLLPNLCSCFETHHLFYNFIEILCQEKKNSILNIQEPKVNLKLLDYYFSENSTPIPTEAIITELTTNLGYSNALAASTIRALINKSVMKESNDHVYPINLNKNLAVAHLLADNPNGLPWKDISRIVNLSGSCKTTINENRLDSNYASETGYIYLSGRGTYKHIKFFPIDNIDIPAISNEILSYFKKHELKSIHLNDFYHQASKYIRSIDYFDIRHLVRTFGTEYGLYFKGKSGVDGVGLAPDFVHITQRELILEIMNKSETALTKVDIASRLVSKSLGHASFYLDAMQESGEVVRVDHMMYTTPDKAFKDVDVETILCLMDDILIREDHAVEADIFRLNINRELNLSYPKYFYSALAQNHLHEFGWYKVYNLISHKEIPFNNITDAISSLCDKNLSNSENIERLSKHILMTNQAANDSINNWIRYVSKSIYN